MTVIDLPLAAPVTPDTTAAPQPHRWTFEEYDRLTELGFFHQRRVELIDGEILSMPPQNEPHIAGILLTSAALSPFLIGRYVVRSQMPLRLGETSNPEPDIAVVPGGPRDYLTKGHPTSAALVVEVSESTLLFDTTVKANLYAAAGIQDYWVLNLVHRRLEVRRRPIPASAQRFGHTYEQFLLLSPADAVSPLLDPAITLKVADLLP